LRRIKKRKEEWKEERKRNIKRTGDVERKKCQKERCKKIFEEKRKMKRTRDVERERCRPERKM